MAVEPPRPFPVELTAAPETVEGHVTLGSGLSPRRSLDDAALLDKLVEEVAELREAGPAERIEEAADLLEVLRALINHSGHSWETLLKAAERKRSIRGGFRVQGVARLLVTDLAARTEIVQGARARTAVAAESRPSARSRG